MVRLDDPAIRGLAPAWSRRSALSTLDPAPMSERRPSGSLARASRTDAHRAG